MPRVDHNGGARFQIAGCYEKLLLGQYRFRRMFDPRLYLYLTDGKPLPPEDQAVWDWLRAERIWQAELDLGERIAAGEPFEVQRWYFGGHSIPRQDSWPAWLRPGSDVRTVRVFSDDTVAPADD
jgi:hypothetical protein